MASIFSEQALLSSTAKTKQEFLDKNKDKLNETYTQEEIDKIIEEVADKIRNGERGNEGMIRNAEKLSSILKEMNWRFLIAPTRVPYLTSDNPVFYFELENPNSELIFPVSSDVALSLSWKEVISAKKWKKRSKGLWEVDDTTVAHIRNLICSIAINEVYYSRKAEWLVDFINNRSNKT